MDTHERKTVEDNDEMRLLEELLDELANSEDSDEVEEEEDAEAELAKSQEQLVEELVAQGSTPEDARGWVADFCSYTANETEHLKDDDDELLALLDGPFKVLRDDTFPDPDRLLVWDRKATPSVQALTFEEATERYQCGGAGSRWVREDLSDIREQKELGLEETRSSYARREADPDYEGVCSTPALVVSNNPLRAHRWRVISAWLDPVDAS